MGGRCHQEGMLEVSCLAKTLACVSQLMWSGQQLPLKQWAWLSCLVGTGCHVFSINRCERWMPHNWVWPAIFEVWSACPTLTWKVN